MQLLQLHFTCCTSHIVHHMLCITCVHRILLITCCTPHVVHHMSCITTCTPHIKLYFPLRKV